MARARMPYQFTGGAQGIVGAVSGYLNNAGPVALLDTSPIMLPVVEENRRAKALHVHVRVNAWNDPITFTVHRNGAPTAPVMQVVVGAGATGLFEVTDEEGVDVGASGLDVHFTCPDAGLLGRMEASALVLVD